MEALGQEMFMERLEVLSKDDIYRLFFMIVGAMTETPVWPTFYMVLNEMLPTFEVNKSKV